LASITSDGKLLLESKNEMPRRGVPSPDEGDAVALCFREPGGSSVPKSIALNFNRRIENPHLWNCLDVLQLVLAWHQLFYIAVYVVGEVSLRA
jgi:hypothetical protein